ncbi:MAG: hypothetical protein HFACDABA_00466 [Anaerolineales bacterium]|nr:hypothetical protein [Anaerolineales bacterium]
MQKWDYKTLTVSENRGKWVWSDTQTEKSEQERLKELGKEGWELVGVALYQGQFSTLAYYYYFKRPLE